MTMADMGDPMARADKLRLQKQVSDLVELTKQQAMTIRRLEKDSLAKSDRIADLETRPQPVNPSLVNSMKMAELRLVQLQQEVDHWRNLAQEKERQAKENKKSFQPPPPATFSPLQDISLNNEEESLYIRRLLEENRKMKQQLRERELKEKALGRAEDADPVQPEQLHAGSKSRVNKENVAPLQTRASQESVAVQCGGGGMAPGGEEGGRKGDWETSGKENYNQDTQTWHAHSHTRHSNEHLHRQHHDLQVKSQHLQGHNKCLQHQVCRLQEELVRRASQISCSCPPQVSRDNQGSTDRLPSSDASHHHRGMPGPPRKRASCPACRQHLCQPRASQEVRWEARVEPSAVHLCSHVRCLQRQLCHLKLQLQQAGGSKEVRRLEDRVKVLEEEKRRLQDKVKQRGGEKEVVEVVEGIERQRDMYKTHIERLIRDLQSGASRVEVVNEVTRALEEEEGGRRDEDQEQRERRTLASRSTEFHPPPPPVPPHRNPQGASDSQRLEEISANLRIMSEKLSDEEKKRKEDITRCEDAEKRRLEAEGKREEERRKREAVERSLAEARGEAMTLRKELREALAELARGREIGTQTSPAVTARVNSASEKVTFLERQLGLTESGLASCQRQLAEQSSAYCDLQSQVVQLRAAAQEGRQEVQELRGRLGRKEDQLGRVIGDRDSLRKQLEDAMKNLEEERREKDGREERLRVGSQAREDAERRLSEAQVKVAQLQRRVEEENRKVSELRTELAAREDASGSLKVSAAEARGDADAAREALRREREEGRGRREEVKDLQAELQRYVAEVRRMEEVVGAKESARRDLLEQYDELTREVQAFETANRSLEMKSANLVLEVRAREDDLKAAKDRCQDLENHLEEILQQNQVFRLQIQELSAKVDLLTTNLKENRVTRDSVVHDLDSVNELAVRLNTEKIELLSKMEAQNSKVESLQAQLGQVREELLGTMSSLEKERHRAQTLQTLVATSSREERETVIRQLDSEERLREDFLTGRNDWQDGGSDQSQKK